SGLINGNLSGSGLIRSTLTGALTGGVIQGLGSSIDGRSFWDGAKIDYKVVFEDAALQHTMQKGENNCTCATAEMANKAQGGNLDQITIRNWNGGDPKIDPLDDLKVIRSLTTHSNFKMDGIQDNVMQGYSSKGHYISSSLNKGRSVVMTVPGTGGVGHSVSVKGVYIKNIVKINGFLKTEPAFKIFDPARSNPYFVSLNYITKNASIIFSLWK
nr:hypothetical protein [Saprospiraceae bacterium]